MGRGGMIRARRTAVECPFCKSQLPDNAVFCAQCGQPQTTAAKALVRSKARPWAIVFAFLSLALAAYVVVHLVNDATREDATKIKPRATSVATMTASHPPGPNGMCNQVHGTPGQVGFGLNSWRPRADGQCYAEDEPAMPPPPPPPQPHAIPIGTGAMTVAATSYSWYQLLVPPGVTTVSVTGHFTATGGMGNDIMVYILDEDGFTNFKNGHPSNTYYNSGKVTTASIGAVLPNAPASYYLVMDNRFSLLTPKAVQLSATLNYLQ
jgi:hypothetical protein